MASRAVAEPAPRAAEAGKANRAATQAALSSGVVDIASGNFDPSQTIIDEIAASGSRGLDVRIIAKGLTDEGRIKLRQDSRKKIDSMGKGSMPILNPWTQKLGGMHLNFAVGDSAIKDGQASFKPRGGDKNDWLQALQKNATLLGGLGLKVERLPVPVNKFEGGKLVLGVTGVKVLVGGYVDANFDLLVENMSAPKVNGSAKIDIKGAATGELTFDNTGEQLKGSVSLAVQYKSFSGAVKVTYLADGTVDVAGKAAYSADKLSGEIQFVSTDLDAANKFARDAISAAGGKENVQSAGAPAAVPKAKEGQKKRALAATGQLGFNLTKWFAGTVNVVVDGKGAITVIGKIAPPGEIILFKQRDWDKEIVKFEAKAYYGIPVVGNLNLFANISLHAIAKLGPAKLYAIEILGTYSTDPEIQKSIQISGSLNISAYAGLRLRAEGGAGIEILDHDLKFGVGLQADIGVKAYADARPTIGYRDPGEFYVSGTLDMVAQPMLGLGGDFFIAIETPWWSPLSDDRWTWPLFSKEWPLSDPIGISASVKDYVLGSGKVPEVEMKKPEFDPSKFMTSMVDDKLPNKSGGAGTGKGSFKEDGSVPKPVVPPKKPAPKSAPAALGKKGASPKAGKSGKPDPKAGKEKDNAKILQTASKSLAALKGKPAFTRSALDQELAKIKAQAGGVAFEVQAKGAKWSVKPKAGGKTGKGVEVGAKETDDKRTPDQKKSDLHKAILAATAASKQPGTTRKSIAPTLEKIRKDYVLKSLVTEDAGPKKWDIVGEINPIEKSPPIPSTISEDEAIALLGAYITRSKAGPAGSLSFTLKTVASAKTVFSKVFRHAVHEVAPAGPSAAPASAIAATPGQPGVYTFEGGTADQASAVVSFRELKERMLVFHVDVQRFKITQISSWFREQRIRLLGVIETQQADLAKGRTIPGQGPNFIIDLANQTIVDARQRLENLTALEENFNRKKSAYLDLEKRGVLFGHQGLAVGHEHRANPHINLEGRPYYVSPTDAGPYLDVTIFIAEA
jgi:hypothetical protein